MPAEFDKCVRGMMKDPDFKPEEGKDKKSSAFAICTSQYKKRHGGQSPTMASIENMSLEELMQQDPDLRFVVALLNVDREIKSLNGIN